MCKTIAEKKYYGCIDLSVQNNSHTQAFNFIKNHCEDNKIDFPQIFEIGCSSGYFSSLLRDHGMYVYGVEPFTNEAKANNRVNEFYHGTVENFCIEEASRLRQNFDAIVLGDVLEHLIDPSIILNRLSNFLNKNGIFVASVPNITHIGIQRMIEDGEWIYQKYGILDSTHLRFFNWRSLRDMFIDNGFGIERKYDVIMPEENVYPHRIGLNSLFKREKSRLIPRFIPRLINSARKRIRKAQSLINNNTNSPFYTHTQLANQGNNVFQYVVSASRKALKHNAFIKNEPKKILLVAVFLPSSLVDIRLKDPLQIYLNRIGGELKIVTANKCEYNDLLWADILIVHRETSLETVGIMSIAQRLGIPVVYDTDDWLAGLPSWSSTYHQTLKQIAIMEQVIATAARVTCTTQCLKEQLLKHTDKIEIVPNIIPKTEKLYDAKSKQFDENCSLIVSSSDTIVLDFLMPVIEKICQLFPKIKVIAIGKIADKFNNITSNLTQYQQCSPQEFSYIIGGIDNAIGLIPLDDSLFSSCKSPVKYYHYTSCGVITVASKVRPYIDYIHSGKDGFLVDNTLDAWSEAITKLISDVSYRTMLLSNAQKTWLEFGCDETAIAGWDKAFHGLPKPFARTKY